MGQRRIESFLVRVIIESDGAQQPGVYRGRVQSIANGTTAQFTGLADLATFIAANTTFVAASPSAAAEASMVVPAQTCPATICPHQAPATA